MEEYGAIAESFTQLVTTLCLDMWNRHIVVIYNIGCYMQTRTQGACGFLCVRCGDGVGGRGSAGSVGVAVDGNFTASGRERGGAGSSTQVFCVSGI